MVRRARRRISAAAVSLLVLLLALLFFGLSPNEISSAGTGCCSRHEGVCGCVCCDGSPLSDRCRDKISGCGGDSDGPQTSARSFSGKVVKVNDGDTIEVMREGENVRIRLADIDCPEMAQDFGARAKRFTAGLAFGKIVRVKVRAVDRYGRTVADVVLPDGSSLNAGILEAGLAWWYRDYSKDKRLEAIEQKAREAKKGLWSRPDPIPPWVFRRRH